MKKISAQKGGVIEILVALLVFAIGVLALQYRAVEATSEAIHRVQAVNIARDMASSIALCLVLGQSLILCILSQVLH